MKHDHPLAWLPPFMVGVASAVAAEISLGLLLYAGPRLLRSLTVILAVLLGALALGLWSAPRTASHDVVEAVRRRWLLALAAFAVAAATAGAWSALGGLASASATRGLGLALLAALPMFAGGAVLGAIGATRPAGAGGVAATAALGAATGAVFMGLVLVPTLIPVSMYVFCLVALSAGALVHGRVLDRRPEDRLIDEEPSILGTVRVTDRVWGSPRRLQRRLTVGGWLVGGTEGEGALRPWEDAVAAWTTGNGSPPGPGRPVVLLGGGAVVLQERLREAGRSVLVVERNPVVWRMTVRHFGLPREADSVQMETGDPLDVSLEVRSEVPVAEGTERVAALGVEGEAVGRDGRVGVVVVDGAAVAPGDAVPLPSLALLRRLRQTLPPDGLLALGGDEPEALRAEEAAHELRDRLERAGFPEVAVFAAGPGPGSGRVLVVAGAVGAALPRRLVGMEPLALREAAP